MLTTVNKKCALEIFPLQGGSLKFTLYDWLGPPIKIQKTDLNVYVEITIVVQESLGSELFFSESLILAQNERWRRG